jgi:hypothetical protein
VVTFVSLVFFYEGEGNAVSLPDFPFADATFAEFGYFYYVFSHCGAQKKVVTGGPSLPRGGLGRSLRGRRHCCGVVLLAFFDVLKSKTDQSCPLLLLG